MRFVGEIWRHPRTIVFTLFSVCQSVMLCYVVAATSRWYTTYSQNDDITCVLVPQIQRLYVEGPVKGTAIL